jgi:glutaredoxin
MLIEIFVAPDGCPSCGKAERLVKEVTADYAGVEVREVNIIDALDRVVNYGVMTTPFIVIDGNLEFVGVPREADLRTRLGQRAVPSDLK